MRADQVYPKPPAPANACDWSSVADLQQELVKTVEAMDRLVDEYGMARQILEFSGEQRKRVLAVAASPLIKAGQSASAAEIEARSSEPYKAALKQLATEFQAAEAAVAGWTVLKLRWETCRSLLSIQKEGMKQL